jgi:hypothetical protein
MTTSRQGWGILIALAVPLLTSCTIVSRLRTDVKTPTASRTWRLVPVAPTTATKATVNLEDPGKIVVVTDGPVCGESVGMPGNDRVVALAGSFTLPAFADRATVFLNGWSLRYLQSDHHVKEIAAVIRSIALDGQQLTWTAAGTIVDHNRDDHFEFCYVYTILAWNGGAVDAVADHREIPEGATFYNGVSNNGLTALTKLSSYRPLPSVRPALLPPQDTVVILPRGFRFEYEDDDHHVLQLALNIDHNEFFVQAGKEYGRLSPPLAAGETSRVDPGITTWDTGGILKDNDVGRRYAFEQQYSTLTGTGLSVVRPPYSIAPGRTPGFFGACLANPGPEGIKREPVEIRNLAFDYAVPVLSGWDLDYGCDDEHVTQAGVWLEEIRYQKDLSETLGVLRYTVASVLRDKNFSPPHAASHRVDIVGLKGTQPTDLIPRASKPQLCERDEAGHLLVSVANVGAGDARPSITRIDFAERSFDFPTPSVKTGSVVVVVGPIGCPGGEPAKCGFTITVDANNDVTETNEANNVAKGLCIG